MKTIVIAVFAVGCSPAMPSDNDPPGARIDAGRDDIAPIPDADLAAPLADPGQPGPFAVGVRTIEVFDPARSRTLPVDVWYPSLGDGSQNTYELEPIASIESPASRDATPVAGNFPVVIFSHGFGARALVTVTPLLDTLGRREWFAIRDP